MRPASGWPRMLIPNGPPQQRWPALHKAPPSCRRSRQCGVSSDLRLTHDFRDRLESRHRSGSLRIDKRSPCGSRLLERDRDGLAGAGCGDPALDSGRHADSSRDPATPSLDDWCASAHQPVTLSAMATSPFPLMHSTLVAPPFHRAGWVYEEKVDGYRMVAHKDGAAVRLISRQGKEFT